MLLTLLIFLAVMWGCGHSVQILDNVRHKHPKRPDAAEPRQS
ncbi:MAG: hypothetical protein ABIT76_01720 [Chthoniobacterales bacterium]